MPRDATDLWAEAMPDVSDRRALRKWLDAMPQIESTSMSTRTTDDLVYKTFETPPVAAAAPTMSDEQSRAWNDWAKAHVAVAREETNILADEAGAMIGKLERRVRKLEMQVRYEKKLQELETKLNQLSADMDTDHARTAAPLIPLRGGRDAAG
jgi:hypothetical protein